MKEQIAKQQVVRAGLELVESGLIARTWGNVSCRIDDKTFAITPSGRPYETLKPEEVVLCSIADTTYEGDIKPSSEKGIHALVYQTNKDINFVIHTHQPVASVISASGISKMPPGGFELLGEGVPIAAYGLPGTKTLKKNVEAVLNNKGHAVILAHHGALCYGKDYEETFLAAKQLEEACSAYIGASFLKVSGAGEYSREKLYQHYVSAMIGEGILLPDSPIPLYSSRKTPEGFILEADTEKTYRFTDKMTPEVRYHCEIYKNREDINFICQDADNGLLALSYTNTTLRPLLDDFAQIVGHSAKCVQKASPDT
ncbi:MAG: class II aldolase/adducin family protein, partial [Mobilitalea sp.]